MKKKNQKEREREVLCEKREFLREKKILEEGENERGIRRERKKERLRETKEKQRERKKEEGREKREIKGEKEIFAI